MAIGGRERFLGGRRGLVRLSRWSWRVAGLVRVRCAGLAGKGGFRLGLRSFPAERAGCLPPHHGTHGHHRSRGHRRAGASGSARTATMSHRGGPDRINVTLLRFGSGAGHRLARRRPAGAGRTAADRRRYRTRRRGSPRRAGERRSARCRRPRRGISLPRRGRGIPGARPPRPRVERGEGLVVPLRMAVIPRDSRPHADQASSPFHHGQSQRGASCFTILAARL